MATVPRLARRDLPKPQLLNESHKERNTEAGNSSTEAWDGSMAWTMVASVASTGVASTIVASVWGTSGQRPYIEMSSKNGIPFTWSRRFEVEPQMVP